MDNRKFDVLLKAVDCGNLTRAAMQLGYTQSGVTHIINNLEQDFGFPLLHRTNRGVSLTEDGKRVLPIIREMQKLDERLQQEKDLIQGIASGSICIGSFSSISTHWLPRVLSAFQRQYPNINVEILEGSTTSLVHWLQEGKVDICFFTLRDDHLFDKIEIMRDSYLALFPKGHPLGKHEAVTLDMLRREPFIMYRTPEGGNEDLGEVMEIEKTAWNIRFSSNYDYAVISMVENNLGISIMPELVLKGHDSDIETRPLRPVINRRLGLAVRSRRDASPAMKRFIACATDILLPKSEA
ncbi:MAG: LysR family transcriptional regulator [Clostridia bacterium]|nr:LysR family transcriptional regulator [Clostridia bacterium]